MKQFKHIGSYGLILKNDSIVLIKKVGGPYNGKLDLPGGTIEFKETPEEALKRELKEEVGIEITDYEIFDANSVNFEWVHKEQIENIHHIGIFYKINNYKNDILENIDIDNINDDSMGARYYKIKDLKRNELSNIAILELEKLGYKLSN
ncbi:MAG: NUDIX domain-containing protein [Bacilli bacterium]|nr:NUDIX domain-containing protein [Bacilli bacterium]